MDKFSVKSIRINLGLSQKEMADLLGITLRAYIDKENGITKWFWDEIKKISDIGNIEIKKIK